MTSTQLRTTRRTIVRGAAWSVPVVSVAAAAPAFAASPCNSPVTGAVSFAATGGNYTRINGGLGRATVTMSDGSTLIVTFTATMTAGYSRQAGNLESGNTSFVPGSLALLQQRDDEDTSVARGQDLVISFDRPVFGLSVPITALSWPTNNYQDAVWVSPAPTNASKGSNVIGTGLTTDPFRNPNAGDNPPVPYQGPTTGATLTYGGGTSGLSSVTVHYYDRGPGNNNNNNNHAVQGMAVQNLAFTAKRVGCA